MNLKNRILDIAKKKKLSHVGSALSMVDIIDEIYRQKKKDDIFILSAGHGFLAWAVVLEEYEGKNAEDLIEKHGVHPTFDMDDGIFCSTGSLGQGVSVALGLALGFPNRKIYCLVSDGETSEGVFWESLRIAQELKVKNLLLYISANGWGGLKAISAHDLRKRINGFSFPVKVVETKNEPLPETLDAHYMVITEDLRA